MLGVQPLLGRAQAAFIAELPWQQPSRQLRLDAAITRAYFQGAVDGRCRGSLGLGQMVDVLSSSGDGFPSFLRFLVLTVIDGR